MYPTMWYIVFVGGGEGGVRGSTELKISEITVKFQLIYLSFFLFIWFYRKHSAFSPPVWKINAKFMVTTQKMCRTHTKWWPPYTCPRAISLKPWKLTKRCLFLLSTQFAHHLVLKDWYDILQEKFLFPHCHVLFSLLTSTISFNFPPTSICSVMTSSVSFWGKVTRRPRIRRERLIS